MIFMLHNLWHLLRGRTASKIHDPTTNLGFIVQATYLAASTQSEEFFILMFSSLNDVLITLAKNRIVIWFMRIILRDSFLWKLDLSGRKKLCLLKFVWCKIENAQKLC